MNRPKLASRKSSTLSPTNKTHIGLPNFLVSCISWIVAFFCLVCCRMLYVSPIQAFGQGSEGLGAEMLGLSLLAAAQGRGHCDGLGRSAKLDF